MMSPWSNSVCQKAGTRVLLWPLTTMSLKHREVLWKWENIEKKACGERIFWHTVPMFFIFFIFLLFEIFSLAMISNASIKVQSPSTQEHSRTGFIALSFFVVKHLLEMFRKVIGTISWLAYSNIINTSCAILLPSILHGHDLTWMYIY